MANTVATAKIKQIGQLPPWLLFFIVSVLLIVLQHMALELQNLLGHVMEAESESFLTTHSFIAVSNLQTW